MVIKVDDEVLFTVSDSQKDILKYMISSDGFNNDLKARLDWVLSHKCDQALMSMKREWDAKLIAREEALPEDPDDYATLVLSQGDYKDKYDRDQETM